MSRNIPFDYMSDPHVTALRGQRETVYAGTDAAQQAFFVSEDIGGLRAVDRAVVALVTAALSGSDSLVRHYANLAIELGLEQGMAALLGKSDWSGISDQRLRAMLNYAEVLVSRPIEGDREALERLADFGLTTKGIVILSQLIAFVTYQVRLAAGLKLLAGQEFAA